VLQARGCGSRRPSLPCFGPPTSSRSCCLRAADLLKMPLGWKQPERRQAMCGTVPVGYEFGTGGEGVRHCFRTPFPTRSFALSPHAR
jgi:hypothetical protein